jgi:hypothetical protein
MLRSIAGLFLLAAFALDGRAAEIIRLSPETWDEYAPAGKEVDCIYGDLLLTNDGITAVIGNPVAGRNANMTVRDVGGCLIDCTMCDNPNDQLSAFYPGNKQCVWELAGALLDGQEAAIAENAAKGDLAGQAVTLRLTARLVDGGPHVELRYTVEDDHYDVRVETIFTNRGQQPIDIELADSMRADRTFDKTPNGASSLFVAYDEWFDQAYGVLCRQQPIQIVNEGANSTVLRYTPAGQNTIPLAPGESHRLTRSIIPERTDLGVKSYAMITTAELWHNVHIQVHDLGGVPVEAATIEITAVGQEAPYGRGRTGRHGLVPNIALLPGKYQVTVQSQGREAKTVQLNTADSFAELDIVVGDPAWVEATITDADGGPIACKVQFRGRDGTPDPYFGPDSGERAIHNLVYSESGRFTQPLPPGKYDVIVSHGPEYDAVFTTIDAVRGQRAPLAARLVRSVDTTGWVSADFHSHSSPSGDNTTSQRGRVLNLLAEHLEFAPCTEHNRVTNYGSHLEALDAVRRLATCSGIELTGSQLPINHQNAFPIVEKPRTQDGGGPLTDADPEAQISRLALWDDRSEKLVQENHPDMGWLFFDRDQDGQPDEGFKNMVGFMDVIEVHPPKHIFEPPLVVYGGKAYNNTMFNWLQLLNQGRRLPGVVNTDAHYTFHGSGFLRNYLKSATDDPAEIDTLAMVRAAERGHATLTNGPFLEVELTAADGVLPGSSGQPHTAGPGDDLAAPAGMAQAHIRVQCSNWIEVNRVQVFINGRPVESLNFTRPSHPDLFADGAVRFDQTIPLTLPGDAHIIIAAAGEGATLGPVMGPDHGQDMPIAVSNPIFIDVDGNGFQANGDTLGAPLPVAGGKPAP